MLSLTAPGLPARAGAPTTDPDEARVGIQLLDAPVARRGDPRALRYIVDHLPPGTTIERRIRVVNRSAERQRLALYPAAASIVEDRFQFAEGRTNNELSSWISLDQDAVDLAPGEAHTATATIRVPPTAPAGERYGVIWASTVTDPAARNANVMLVKRVGIRVYLNVGPGGEPASDFVIGSLIPARDRDGRPSVTVTVRNTGARALDLTGRTVLSDGPGGLRAGPFDIVLGTTLAPGETGTVMALFPAELPNGPWRIDIDLASGTITRKASSEIRFPDPGQTGEPGTLLTRLRSPWVVLGLVLTTGLSVLVVVLLRRRARRSRRGPPAPPPGAGQVAASTTGSTAW